MAAGKYIACFLRDEEATVLLRAHTVDDLFHQCQKAFGCCIGRLVSHDYENPVWRFAKCQGKYESCKTQITDIKVYWEVK